MLLPSDVARLVLGYLQEEGLSGTSQAFIHESPNLKEYADHTTGDGAIPACLFSVFGKGLTTILNEYVATRTKESCHEVPAVMTSLWKKLDFTLNQIKSLQNSHAESACQRTRSCIGVANSARQRVLTVASAGAVVCSSVCEMSPVVNAPHSVLSHSTPVSYTATHSRPPIGSGTHQQNLDVRFNAPMESPVQASVSEQRLTPGPMSPGRRKWDTLRKRGGTAGGSSGPSRCAANASGLAAESQLEQAVDENFPQLVIQNARDKILGDRSLQEKLAENINKILAIDPMPQTPKASLSTVEAEQSIEEILGLQGEIHMTDDAIHDILEQTESDPAFQALYDLFDYNKTRLSDGEAEIVGGTPEESDTAEPLPAARPLQSNPGITHRDANALNATSMKVKTGQERKTRKSTTPTLLKKTLLAPSSKVSRIENCSARLFVTQRERRAPSPAPVDPNKNEKASLLDSIAFVTPMKIDEPLNTPPLPSDSMANLEAAFKDITSTTTVRTESTAVPESSAASAVSHATPAGSVDQVREGKRARGSKGKPAAAVTSQSDPPAFLSPLPVEVIGIAATPSADLAHVSMSSGGGDAPSLLTLSVLPEAASSTSVPTAAPFTATPASPAVASASATLTASPAVASTSATLTASAEPASPAVASTSATLTASADPASPAVASTSATLTASAEPAPSTSCVPVAAAPDPLTADPSKSDSNVVSLKIIICDNQSEESSSDAVLKQAISSISGENIPTIFLSPAKSPGVPGTPKASLDEAAQAVVGLQSSELHASPLSGKTAALAGTSQVQQNYVIRLPLDTASPALQGATTSYFLVTETPTKDALSRQVLLSAGVPSGPPFPINQYRMPTATTCQGYSPVAGPALILPSPIKPMMLPVSVMGQNTLGTLPMLSNQFVAIPNAVPLQQSESVTPKSPTLPIKLATAAATDQHLVGSSAQPVSAEAKDQPDAAEAFRHKRILFLDSPSDVQPPTANTTSATFSPAPDTLTTRSVQETPKDNAQSGTRTKPAILGGNKPKRRVVAVKCPVDAQTDRCIANEAEKSAPLQQRQIVKKNSRKQGHSIHYRVSRSESNSRVEASQRESSKQSESDRRSKSTDGKQSRKEGDGEKAKDSQRSGSLSSDSAPQAGTTKEKEESSKKEVPEKAPAKSCEGRAEKRAPSQGMPNVTANKENEIKGSMQEQQQQSTSSSAASRDSSPPSVSQPASNPQSKATKTPSKTSSLAKQAAEMLHDIQELGSPSLPAKRAAEGSSDLGLPRLAAPSRNQEEMADCPRTPSRPRRGKKNGEGTPKTLTLANTPEVPACSPGSEAGSENSVNMAAHTLMILSRAAMSRPGTPLKDSLRQEGVGDKSPEKSMNPKKRKLSSPTVSPPAKKDRDRKKLFDCFPHDLDVDKFLSSLHYDE